MGATVVAVLKKAAVAVLTHPKVLKIICGIVLGVVLIIIMPVAAVIALLNGDIQINNVDFQRVLEQQMTSEHIKMLENIETVMYDIEDAMDKAEMSDRTKEAQVLYTLALYIYADDDEFIERLTGCFEEYQSDEELINTVNEEFGTALVTEDFTNAMYNIRVSEAETSSDTSNT